MNNTPAPKRTLSSGTYRALVVALVVIVAAATGFAAWQIARAIIPNNPVATVALASGAAAVTLLNLTVGELLFEPPFDRQTSLFKIVRLVTWPVLVLSVVFLLLSWEGQIREQISQHIRTLKALDATAATNTARMSRVSSRFCKARGDEYYQLEEGSVTRATISCVDKSGVIHSYDVDVSRVPQ
ncbi:hypothetical protein EPN42_11185 [bacterium]|nr:MAG: hypothetical protein EPN42_11185 [bacterium]